MPPRKRGYKRRPRKTTMLYKGKLMRVSPAIKKYVKSRIASNIENKCVQVNGGTVFGSYLESPVLNAYPMMPLTSYWTIPQGLGQGGRSGNEIRIKSCTLNYIIIPLGYDATTNVVPVPCIIDMYLGHVRQSPTAIPTNADILQLYQNGSSTAGPSGTLRDNVSVINKDYWVMAKRWKDKCGFANYGGTGVQVAQQSYSNNEYKLNAMRKINITKYVPKIIKFNDGNNTTLTKNLFFMYQALSANGQPLSATQRSFDMEFWIDVQYEDA